MALDNCNFCCTIFVIYFQCMYVCMFVRMYMCVFAIGDRTVRVQTWNLAWSWGSTRQGHSDNWGRPHPPTRGGGLKRVSRVRTASTVCFWENFIKQKLKSAPNLAGAGQIRTRTLTRGMVATVMFWTSNPKPPVSWDPKQGKISASPK